MAVGIRLLNISNRLHGCILRTGFWTGTMAASQFPIDIKNKHQAKCFKRVDRTAVSVCRIFNYGVVIKKDSF